MTRSRATCASFPPAALSQSDQHELPGRAAEDLVSRWLESQGLRIWGRNVRLGHLELDVVAIDQRLVVIVEVRSRTERSYTSPLSSLNLTKRKRLRYAADRLWKRYFLRDPDVDRIRFDVACVLVSVSRIELEYVRAAF